VKGAVIFHYPYASPRLKEVGDELRSFCPREEPLSIVEYTGWTWGGQSGWQDEYHTTGIGSPDHPARGDTLYRLRYPGIM